eukprot:CAMPEP_0196815990 /NCGR_PEP_ID=MMETSP1362-20130617/52962_1 /TAXON_ID=163516 /ORGANISM="Leptocylindrus danicus, Strain CCMP1856" /LENGTH=2323 /DNA_ID=CAMNT_0042193161 /DNA_START=128 /DNA_END=7099 /DNA_ORIENTATION=+
MAQDPPVIAEPKQKGMSRNISLNFHRRFSTVESYVKELGGEKGRVIDKVLIANNGNAAIKAIRSIRRWAYEVFGDERAITFVVMATPEDLRANAEYIRMGDIIVDVPGGTNNHNYANVTLIVELARLHRVAAVWAGWGHASENPVLPDTLAQSQPPIKFIGPAGPPMRALGDKIGSTIIAQSSGVPCIAWNGSEISAEYDRETGCLPQDKYDMANITTAEEAKAAAVKVGFPIMIKASEGGGGKGIRMVDCLEKVGEGFRQVSGEVPGSPIFIMKLSSNSRHLEVQLLADEYGNAIALNGRDCSVQRRHQKIIEEGPPIAASPEVWPEMEKAAVSLAKAVGYANAGTVEYLYSESDKKFYFLELNPRLQVEHPVTEMITKVNLPAAQLQVAMGIPLYNIPEIRELYGKNRFEQDTSHEASFIDFDTTERIPPYGHCIAVRITAENAEAGFKPTSGGIQEINFRSTPSVWGYFSMDSSGSIHEFADSQFGHLFANGADREQARRNMVLALKELSIRGEIATTVDYISNLIELDDFIGNKIDTAWLDGIIKKNVDGMALTADAAGFGDSKKKNGLSDHLNAVLGSVVTAYDRCLDGEKAFIYALEKGQLPSESLLSMVHKVELILNGIKYKFVCTRSGPNKFCVEIDDESSTSFVNANVRILSDGGYLIEIGGKSNIAYVTARASAASGMKMIVAGANVTFSPDYDPTCLRTDVAGKLVKKLVPDGTHVKKGESYCEIEVMKMFMPLKVGENGIINWNNNEGAALSAGDLIASLELDNPDAVKTATVFSGDLDIAGWGSGASDSDNKPKPHILLRRAGELLMNGMKGYVLSQQALKEAVADLDIAVVDSCLPVYELDEQLSVLSGRISAKLYEALSTMIKEFKAKHESSGDNSMRFPVDKFAELLSAEEQALKKVGADTMFITLTAPLREAIAPYAGNQGAFPGSERVLIGFVQEMRSWIANERWFCDGVVYSDAVENLRQAHKDDFQTVMSICRAHGRLEYTAELLKKMITSIGKGIENQESIVGGASSIDTAIPCLSEIGSMGGNAVYKSVSLQARRLLLQESLPSVLKRKLRVVNIAKELACGSSDSAQALIDEDIPLADIMLPILNELDGEKERLSAIEIYAKKLYQNDVIKDVQYSPEDSQVKIVFTGKQNMNLLKSSAPMTSMTDLTRMVSSGSLSKLCDLSDSESDAGTKKSSTDPIPATTPRSAVFSVVDSIEALESGGVTMFDSLLKAFPKNAESGPINNLHVFVLSNGGSSDMDIFAERFEAILSQYVDAMTQADIRRVTFVVDTNTKAEEFVGAPTMPAIFTFRAVSDFKEDSLFRHIEPNHAFHLDLTRLSKNFNVKGLNSQQTSTGNIQLYEATPKSYALTKDTKASKAPRIFVRALSFVDAITSNAFESIFVDSMNALDLNGAGNAENNHLFINLISDDRVVLDPSEVEQALMSIIKRHSDRLKRLGLSEVETRLECCLSEGSPPIAIRLVANNPTGFVHVLNTYVEAVDDTETKKVFRLVGGTKASLACSGDSSWEGMDVTTPYPLTRPFDAQRKAAAKSSDTLYCYDLPALFEAAVELKWSDAAAETGVEGSRPIMTTYTTELVVQKKDGSGGSWTMQDYLNGDLELAEMHRGAGANDVGMVAWLMTLKTTEYPEGRQVVLIANDITFKAGSFGTREDVVFKLASEFARAKRVPRLYVAANSGARIGTAEGVKKSFKVAFKDPSKPESGFQYLYVDEETYQRLGRNGDINAEPTVDDSGNTVYKLTDIIGAEPDLGVENLKGSGLIAGETSFAYNDIFTMTIVMGRTVGIGAYLVRLGQRTIQKISSSPIILTGYQALNKLMGVEVYSTNDQLGGPGIMYTNGISHLVAPDHLAVVTQAVEWLSYVPSIRGGLLPITGSSDTIDRTIDFCPTPGAPYDPRCLITGGESTDGKWQSGFFDKGSFVETLGGWAKAVVVGRARLGGIPMGVIITENRTSECVKPADPADVSATENVIQQPGCVWFPNSAYKTAQAINDFRTEDLPLMIFANWRGFSGGQRDMFDEVLKYGSMIVDAFVAYEQPIFVFIPPFAEIRGGAWVVLDASINANVMEMYASSKTARGGVLEANGTASVKYRVKDLIATMHRLDDKLKELDAKLASTEDDVEKEATAAAIKQRENMLLPVYEQIAVKFCELHDTPGRMKATGVIEREVEWEHARTFFFWRLRRKLAEYDLRKKLMNATNIGANNSLSPLDASNQIKEWFCESGSGSDMWGDDTAVLSWMAQSHEVLDKKVDDVRVNSIAGEIESAVTSSGELGMKALAEGICRLSEKLSGKEKADLGSMLSSMMKSLE